MTTCPHPKCDKPIPTTMLACKAHWFQLPKPLRDDIWRGYRYHLRDLYDKSVAKAHEFWEAKVRVKELEKAQGELF